MPKARKKEINFNVNANGCCGSCRCRHMGGGAYGLGVIGSAVYFISTSVGFWAGVLGLLKALVWPAFLVYGLLKFLGI